MRRVGGLLGSRVGHGTTRSMTALDEPVALQEAMAAAAFIMNDEVERAEAELSKGTSPFHKLGRATALFLRATLGFEKEIMEQAGARLAEAEEAAAEHQRRAVRDHSTAHRSAIYPPGAEHALCHAETQLMSAVVAVLTESLTESLKGFYKLRKAFSTLHEIHEAEKRYLQTHGHSAASSQSSVATPISPVPNDPLQSQLGTYINNSGVLTPSTEDDDDDDNLDFVDAEDGLSNVATPADYQGNLEYPDMKKLELEETITEKVQGALAPATQPAGVEVNSKSAADQADQDVDFRTITSDPVDLFIHSGTALCYGLLQLLLSMIPPAFAKLLSIFSFRGDRETGLRMLWSATKFKHNINGAMAGLIVLGFHSAPLAFCDIISKDAIPEQRLRKLLFEMRELYPKSKLWLLEEARMLSRERKVEEAVSLVRSGPDSSLKQVEALGVFETSLMLLYVHRYQECADSFIKCVGLNNWSHALYYFIAGVCHVELYRIHKDSDPEKAKTYAASAKKHLQESVHHTGKKRFMARQLPFDVFVNRKVTKWDARAKQRNCDLVDAVGVSPAVEIAYFWSGFRLMRPEHVQMSLDRLAWSENSTNWQDEPADEQAIHGFLRGASLRFLGRTEEAKSVLTDSVLPHDLHALKACEHADTWPLPVAHYEMAVCYWQEAGREQGDKATLAKCSEHLETVSKWESFDLEARIGLKVTTGRQTLKKIDESAV